MHLLRRKMKQKKKKLVKLSVDVLIYLFNKIYGGESFCVIIKCVVNVYKHRRILSYKMKILK